MADNPNILDKNLSVRNMVSVSPMYVLTGTTAETVMGSYTIPVGMYQSVFISAIAAITNTANNKTLSFYINTVNPSNLCSSVTTATNSFIAMRQVFGLGGGYLFGAGQHNANPWNFGPTQFILAIDSTQPLVLYIAGQLDNTADSITLEQVSVMTQDIMSGY